MARVKICGINAAAAAEAAAAADWIGFVFHPASPRHVTPRQAAALSSRLPATPLRVGLFVNPTDADIARTLDALPLHALQLYAPAARLAQLHATLSLPLWHAIGIATPADLPHTTQAAALVIEARPPADAASPGGNATTLDWTMLAGWTAPAPWLLAGGLTPDNVAHAIARSGAAAVDVSSGVESRRGVKDPALIARFIAAAHAIPPATPYTA